MLDESCYINKSLSFGFLLIENVLDNITANKFHIYLCLFGVFKMWRQISIKFKNGIYLFHAIFRAAEYWCIYTPAYIYMSKTKTFIPSVIKATIFEWSQKEKKSYGSNVKVLLFSYQMKSQTVFFLNIFFFFSFWFLEILRKSRKKHFFFKLYF